MTSAFGRYPIIIFSSDIYYLAFPNDSVPRKILVYAVYIAEMVQSILLARTAYTEFASGFGNLEAINKIGLLLTFAVPILSSTGMCYSFSWPCVIPTRLLTSKLVAAVVQTFYAYRIKLLAHSYYIPFVIVLVKFSSSPPSRMTKFFYSSSLP